MLGRLAPLVRRRATFASSLPAGSRGVSGVLSKSPKSPSATLRRAPVKKAVKSQSSVAWADMPASKLDANGMPIGPLDALPDAPESMRKGSSHYRTS